MARPTGAYPLVCHFARKRLDVYPAHGESKPPQPEKRLRGRYLVRSMAALPSGATWLPWRHLAQTGVKTRFPGAQDAYGPTGWHAKRKQECASAVCNKREQHPIPGRCRARLRYFVGSAVPSPRSTSCGGSISFAKVCSVNSESNLSFWLSSGRRQLGTCSWWARWMATHSLQLPW